MSEEKRMVDSYEVKQAVYISDKEILFCEDYNNPDFPYMVCDCKYPMGMEHFFDGNGSRDYFEMMELFIARIKTQIEAVRADREKSGVPNEPISDTQCIPICEDMDLMNKVVVLRPERLRPEYRTADHQLVLALGGFGSSPHSRGRAVFTTNLYTGEMSRWNREDILGMPKTEHIPDWAKERLVQILSSRNKKRPDPER